MSGPSSNQLGEVFDLRRIRRLAELMREYDLSEVDVSQADSRIRLRRRMEEVESAGSSGGGAPAVAAPQPAAAPSSAGSLPPEENLHLIKSPMVGTFYAASNPENPPFVKVGDHVGPETTVCIVEAMKVFNEIPAEVSGRVAAVLVENGDPVEFGQPLFKIDTRQ